jgi:cysteine synthase A
MVAIEPEDSAVLPGRPPGPNQIQGIKAGFIPEILHQPDRRNRCVGYEIAFRTCARRRAALAAALETGARAEMERKTIVAVVPDFGQRYFSTALFDEL